MAPAEIRATSFGVRLTMRLPTILRRTVIRLAALACLGVALAGPIWAQCQMCKETASFQKAEAIEALNRGIILLAIPPIAIIGGIVVLTYRHRNGYRLATSENGIKNRP